MSELCQGVCGISKVVDPSFKLISLEEKFNPTPELAPSIGTFPICLEQLFQTTGLHPKTAVSLALFSKNFRIRSEEGLLTCEPGTSHFLHNLSQRRLASDKCVSVWAIALTKKTTELYRGESNNAGPASVVRQPRDLASRAPGCSTRS